MDLASSDFDQHSYNERQFLFALGLSTASTNVFSVQSDFLFLVRTVVRS